MRLCPGNAHLDFEKAMAHEHCHGPGSTVTFKTRNYKITTCALKEWGIIVKKERCPEGEMKYDRKIPDIEELLRSEVSVQAKLTRPEIIAVVLYSGPMVRGLFVSVRCPFWNILIDLLCCAVLCL